MKNCNIVFSEAAKLKSFDELTQLLEDLRFHGVCNSMFNACMIALQRPGAGMVLPVYEWNKRGGVVSTAAVPIFILKPFCPLEILYEQNDIISDGTEAGDELIHRLNHRNKSRFNDLYIEGTATEEILARLKEAANNIGIYVSEANIGENSGGYAIVEKGYREIWIGKKRVKTPFHIVINSGHSVTVKTQTLLHELAHILCGHFCDLIETEKLDSKIQVLSRDLYFYSLDEGTRNHIEDYEAEMVQFLVSERIGIKNDLVKEYLEKMRRGLTQRFVQFGSLDCMIKCVDMIMKEMKMNHLDNDWKIDTLIGYDYI